MKKLLKNATILLLLFAMSCEDDPIDNTKPAPTPGGDDSRDYFELTGAVKLMGEFPIAAEGGLKINVKDTLYLANNHDYQARISVLHDSTTMVSGFYVWVEGTGEKRYYDVPAVEAERKDTITTFYAGFDPPDDEVTFPYTVEIVIQPHGPGGGALDEFRKKLTVEEPVSGGSSGGRLTNGHCTITTGLDRWRWIYTKGYRYTGELWQISAPWFLATYSDQPDNGYYYAKCCIYDPDFGLIEAYPGEPTREGICEFGNPLYKRVLINGSYSLRLYDILYLFENGEFWHDSGTLVSNFIPQESRICDLFAYYDMVLTAYEKIGTHDYSPGASSIKLTTVTATPPFGPLPPSGNFVNTCHLLIFTTGIEEKYEIAYQKEYDGTTNDEIDPMVFVEMWFDL